MYTKEGWAKYYSKHRPQILESQKKYRIKNREKIRLSHKQWSKDNRDRIKKYMKIYCQRHYLKYRPVRLAKAKIVYQKLRLTALIHYGGSPPKCACCEESLLEFLCIDHINGGGSAHRKTLSSKSIYTWLIKNDFPSGFRVLCANCNQAIRNGRICPHQDKSRVMY